VTKTLALAAALVGLVAACSTAYQTQSAEILPKEPSAQRQRQVTSVTQLYRENCANCHGSAGQGGGAGTSTLLTADLYRQEHDRPFFDAIKKGVPDMAMPSFGEVLSDAEIWGLVVHVRELQARALSDTLRAPRPQNGVVKTQRHTYRIETVVDRGLGLQIPWAVDWLPDGRMIVTNRPGQVFVVLDGKPGQPVQGIPEVAHVGQGGMMEVAVHPDYTRNGWIYLAYNEPQSEGSRSGMTKVVRGKIRFEGETHRWVDQQTIFEADRATYSPAGVHFGSRIVFDGQGHLFFSIGDRGAMQHSQDLSRPNGKVFRVREDGSIPSDNPFVGRADALGQIWSYGHRNPQGLVFGLDGNLWSTEHAPRGGDELNVVERAANYGWPVVSFGINYNDTPFRTPWPPEASDITMPVYRWIPSTGVCGLAVATGPAFPNWKGDLLAGGLAGQNIDRIRIENGKIVEFEEIFFGQGRVRDVKTAPDGTIYVVLNDPDKVVRLVPAD
jgi:aldose sugar dehydrogenase